MLAHICKQKNTLENAFKGLEWSWVIEPVAGAMIDNQFLVLEGYRKKFTHASFFPNHDLECRIYQEDMH